MDIDVRAANTAGNWRSKPDFTWEGETAKRDPDNFGLIPLASDQASPLSRHVSAVLLDRLKHVLDRPKADPDCYVAGFAHWLAGAVDSLVIRVRRSGTGSFTPAFRLYHETMEELARDPVADREKLDKAADDATLENIRHIAGGMVTRQEKASTGWARLIVEWLQRYKPEALEEYEFGEGAWPAEAEVLAAVDALRAGGWRLQ